MICVLVISYVDQSMILYFERIFYFAKLIIVFCMDDEYVTIISKFITKSLLNIIAIGLLLAVVIFVVSWKEGN